MNATHPRRAAESDALVEVFALLADCHEERNENPLSAADAVDRLNDWARRHARFCPPGYCRRCELAEGERHKKPIWSLWKTASETIQSSAKIAEEKAEEIAGLLACGTLGRLMLDPQWVYDEGVATELAMLTIMRAGMPKVLAWRLGERVAEHYAGAWHRCWAEGQIELTR